MFERIPILPQADRCLNRGYRQAGCARCVQACPVRAVELHDGAPTLDVTTCVDCGACLPACPTDVFRQRVSPEGLLVQTAEQVNRAEQLAVACAVHPDPANSRAPVERILRHSRCLASLDVDHMLALNENSRSDVWLDDTPCAACTIGQARGLILQTAQAANALLDGFDRPARVRLVSEAPAEQRSGRMRLPVTQAVPGSLARREIFARLKRIGEDAWDEASGDRPASDRLPASRRRLLGYMHSWRAQPEAALAVVDIPFAAVQVSADACSACGLCARLCPTGALWLDSGVVLEGGKRTVGRAVKPSDQDEWRLTFQPAACVDCGICALACPEQAISYDEHLPAQALSDGELTVASGHMTSCVSCGTAVAIPPQQRPALCYACRQGAGRVNPMADTAGLMTDLLKRMPPT